LKQSRWIFKISVLAALAAVLLAACAPAAPVEAPVVEEPAAEAPATTELILATTTSTRDSGLLDELLPIFQEETGYEVKMVAVGTGAALAMGEEGNADVLLVHAPAAEMELVEKGVSARRDLIMHNDFVIVGPPDDPAGIKGMASSAEALAKIAESEAVFVSRGDDSGTHKKEISLWEAAGVTPAGEWFFETGQGMGDSLLVASEKMGYILTDRATYLAQKENLELEIFVEGDPVLLNIYHVMVVNPEMWPKVNVDGANAFADFLISDEVQAMIGEFGVAEFGQPLFFPDAGKDPAELGL